MRGHDFARLYTVVGVVLLSVILTCCSGKEPEAPVDESLRAGGVALECYEALYIDNRPEAFLNGRVGARSLSDENRQQLLTLYKQHVMEVNGQHGGVAHIDFMRAEPDTALNVMQVFLKMTFVDGIQEEIVVPMLQADGKWRME